jgi:hypothetical protein
MHAGRRYSFKEILTWTRRETVLFLCVASIPPTLASLGVDVAVLPWPPVAVLGTIMGGVFINGDHDIGSFCDARRLVHVNTATGERTDWYAKLDQT